MNIYGAGLAGLIAGQMLRHHQPVIHEIQPSLPNNHEAVLRFRSEAVSIATGIPFKRVTVNKQVCYKGSVIDSTFVAPMLSNMYSLKVTGNVYSRSIESIEPVERWVAPSNLIQLLSRGLDIRYGSPLIEEALKDFSVMKISTIPMPTLRKIMTGLDDLGLDFRRKSIWTVSLEIEHPSIDIYQTTYYPGPEVPYYRASIMGSKLIIEYAEKIFIEDGGVLVGSDVRDVLEVFGIDGAETSDYQFGHMPFGKLVPTDDQRRKSVISEATRKYRCYSLGRFATWRQILLDDIVKDVKVIERLMEADVYDRDLMKGRL